MTDKEAINLLEKQIIALVVAGVDMSMDQEFFRVGEYELGSRPIDFGRFA
jgi:hypothetical protein